MALTREEREFIELGLERLYEHSAEMGDDHRQSVREYIDVGEYGLALDDLADIFLQSASKPLSTEIQQWFEDLLLKMGMTDGDEWQGVAQVRKA